MVPRLKRRAEFLRVAGARRKWATPGLVLQVRRRPQEAAADDAPPVRVGFTASRKVGKAVERNRARRRLRALAEEVLPRYAAEGHDYVIIGRRATIGRSFEALREDLLTALKRLKVFRRDTERADPGTGNGES